MSWFTKTFILLAALAAAATVGIVIGREPTPVVHWLEARLSDRALAW